MDDLAVEVAAVVVVLVHHHRLMNKLSLCVAKLVKAIM